MNLNSFRSESTDNANETTNSAKSTLTKKSQQELLNRGEESKSTKTETPNPQKAPLNYIDNMGEWETTQKNYLKEIEQKQQELAAIISAYEDKGEEIDRYRKAKTELEIKLIKNMGAISHKLMEYNEFLTHVQEKISMNLETIESENSDVENDVENDEGGDENIYEGIPDNEQNDGEESQPSPQYEKIKEALSALGIEAVIRTIPIDALETPQKPAGEFYDQVARIIDNFLNLVEHENRNENKKSLNKDEIDGMENLYSKIKGLCDEYMDLAHQIEIINAKIKKLENEESQIFSAYYKTKKETETMGEDMQEVSETYFLNSYLSTKNVKLDSFISSQLVEKQIKNIIEQNRKGNNIPKTILLYGKPNLGKTYAANVLASELGRKMYHIRSYDIFTGGFSDPNAMLDAIFTGLIKKKEPCIVFLDEIEDFAGGYNGSPYQNLMENTIRHHVSKIKDSSLDIMIIGAISDKNKIGTSLLKQDVFSKQIHFDFLSQDRCIDFIHKIAEEYGIKIGNDIKIEDLVKKLKESDRNQEYFKKLLNLAIDYHQLDNRETDNITLTKKDFDKAVSSMSEYNRNISQGVGFSN